MVQYPVFASDDKEVANAVERFNEKVRYGWSKGFHIATDSLRIVLTEKAVVIAAIMEKEK